MSVTVEKCLQAWTNSLRQLNVKTDIVFFGDSLTYYGDFASAFPDKVVCNLGLRGDTIQGMIDRVEQVRMMEPKQVFLMAGINDVGKCNHFQFGKIYDLLIQKILSIIDTTGLCVQSMLPVNDVHFKVSCNNKQIEDCNKEIEKIAYKKNLIFVDLYTEYQCDGLLPKDMSQDGLHIVKGAYDKWYQILRKIIV